MDPLLLEDLKEEYDGLSADGFRVLAIAYRDFEPKAAYNKDDEQRPDPEGLYRFSRSAQGDRRARRSALFSNTESRSRS